MFVRICIALDKAKSCQDADVEVLFIKHILFKYHSIVHIVEPISVYVCRPLSLRMIIFDNCAFFIHVCPACMHFFRNQHRGGVGRVYLYLYLPNGHGSSFSGER